MTSKTARIMLIPILLMLLVGAVLMFGSGKTEASVADTPTIALPGSGTALGANACIIFYTLDNAGGYTVDGIDCPPEGFPETVTEGMTLEEQAHILLPYFEESLIVK